MKRNNLIQITGGALALHKTCWRILAWRLHRGELHILQATEYTILMADGKGAYATIEFKSPDQPNEGLGNWIFPDDNRDHTHRAIMKDIYDLCQKVGAAYLPEQETWQVLRQRLTLKLSYKMQLSSLTKQQCKQINTQIRQNILPKLRHNRNKPGAMIYGPLDNGGMEIKESYALQDQIVGRNPNMAQFPDPSGNGRVGHPAFPTLPKL